MRGLMTENEKKANFSGFRYGWQNCSENPFIYNTLSTQKVFHLPSLPSASPHTTPPEGDDGEAKKWKYWERWKWRVWCLCCWGAEDAVKTCFRWTLLECRSERRMVCVRFTLPACQYCNTRYRRSGRVSYLCDNKFSNNICEASSENSVTDASSQLYLASFHASQLGCSRHHL